MSLYEKRLSSLKDKITLQGALDTAEKNITSPVKVVKLKKTIKK